MKLKPKIPLSSLKHAAEVGNVKNIVELLDLGADINAVDWVRGVL